MTNPLAGVLAAARDAAAKLVTHIETSVDTEAQKIEAQEPALTDDGFVFLNGVVQKAFDLPPILIDVLHGYEVSAESFVNPLVIHEVSLAQARLDAVLATVANTIEPTAPPAVPANPAAAAAAVPAHEMAVARTLPSEDAAGPAKRL